jgi:hypothetical protein
MMASATPSGRQVTCGLQLFEFRDIYWLRHKISSESWQSRACALEAYRKNPQFLPFALQEPHEDTEG